MTNYPLTKAHTRHGTCSDMQRLEQIVACEEMWEIVEDLDAFHRAAGTAQKGPRPRYTLMDIFVMEMASCQHSGTRQAVRVLSDPWVWKRLRRAATRAFPNNPSRRLSPQAPSRQQHYRARCRYFRGEALDVLRRSLRTAAVNAVVRGGLFDAASGSWTHPAQSQCVVGDSTWIPAKPRHGRRGVPDSGTVVERFVRSSGDPASARQDRMAGRELVVLTCRGVRGERVVLDAEFRSSDDTRNRGHSTGADTAVAMLERLLDDNGELLRPGLRGFVYDMAIDSEGIDKVLDMGIVPITKVPRQAGGQHRRASLGQHTFTARGGTCHNHEVIAVGGSPVVELPGSSGDGTTVLLHRQRIRWDRNLQRSIAYCRYTMPDAPRRPRTSEGGLHCHPSQQHRRRSARRSTHAQDPGAAAHTRRRPQLRGVWSA